MPDAPENTSLHIVISGRVQGVGYRAWLRDRALQSGLCGWVRNRCDGDVEAVLSGPKDRVDTVIRACRVGPDWASVEHVRIVSDTAPVEPEFSVKPTL